MGHPHQVLQLLLDVLQEAALGEAALAVLVLHADGDDVLA